MARNRPGSGKVRTRTEDSSGSQALMELIGQLPPEALMELMGEAGARGGPGDQDSSMFMGPEVGPEPVPFEPGPNPPPPPPPPGPPGLDSQALPPGPGQGPAGPVGTGSALSRRGISTVSAPTPFTIPVDGMNIDPRFFMGIAHMDQSRRDRAIAGPGLSGARLEQLRSSSTGLSPALDPSLRRSDPLAISARDGGGRGEGDR